MVYTKDFSIDDFEFWSGAKDTVEDVRKAEKMDELEKLVEQYFADLEEPPTETQVNDFVWFERDYIYRNLGLDENGNLPEEDDEDEEEGESDGRED